MASKTSFSHFAFFFSLNLLFSMFVMSTCSSFSPPGFEPPPTPISILSSNPQPILPPIRPSFEPPPTPISILSSNPQPILPPIRPSFEPPPTPISILSSNPQPILPPIRPSFEPPPTPISIPSSNPESILPPLTPTLPSTVTGKCPRDAIKIGICAKLLNEDLLKVILGEPPVTSCCTLIQGLADLEAGICLCTAIKASVLGINLNKIPISLNLLLNNCAAKVPPGFQCP